jgi:hypothetical protein
MFQVFSSPDHTSPLKVSGLAAGWWSLKAIFQFSGKAGTYLNRIIKPFQRVLWNGKAGGGTPHMPYMNNSLSSFSPENQRPQQLAAETPNIANDKEIWSTIESA